MPATWTYRVERIRRVVYDDVGAYNGRVTEDRVRADLGLADDHVITEDDVKQWCVSESMRTVLEDEVSYGFDIRNQVTEAPGPLRAVEARNMTPQNATVPTAETGGWRALRSSPSPYRHPSDCPCSACMTNLDWAAHPVPLSPDLQTDNVRTYIYADG